MALTYTNDHIAADFRELHGWYVRATEVCEAFLEQPAAVQGPAAADLVRRYIALQRAIGQLITCIQHELPKEPDAYAAWQHASKEPRR